MAYDGLANPTGIEWGNSERTFGQVKFGDDSAQVVVFYTRSVFNAAKSKAKGARFYENEIWVKMHPPGERLNVIDRPVSDLDKIKYQRQWNLFLQNKTQVPDGTPIDLLFPNSPATADSLKAFNVHTIQQCANLSSHALQTIGMGAQDWANMAKQYLDSASSGTSFLKLRSELDQEKQDNRILRQQYDKIRAQLDDVLRRINLGSGPPQPWPDAPGQQIAANHPSNPAPNKSRAFQAPPSAAMEQADILKQVVEEDFPVVDVTKDQPNDLDFGLGAKKD